MQQITFDLLDIEHGVICHQVNCQGVMGSGIALQIRNKWPRVYSEYKRFCSEGPPLHHLGMIQLVPATERLLVCNVFGQLGYCRGIQQTDYAAVHQAFMQLHNTAIKYQVYVPYNMGCGLGGGNWTAYLSIIEQTIPTAIIVKLP